MNSASTETRPLALAVGNAEVVLVAADVDVLLDGIERIAEGMRELFLREHRPGVLESLKVRADDFEALWDALVLPGRSVLDPPLEVTARFARRLREVLADIDGYQRGELTPGLRELRVLLGTL